MGARLRSWLCGGLCALAAACGGGGGGGGSQSPPPPTVTGNGFAAETGPGDTQEYFPNAIGNSWRLDYTATENGLPTSGQLTVTVSGTRTVLGKNAFVLNQVDSGDGLGSRENYYYLSGGGITYVGTNDAADVITPQIVPYVQLRFPVSTGSVSSLSASNLLLDQDPQAGAITLDMTQQIVNTGFEDVEVVAGSFPGALKQTTTISGLARSQASSVTVPVSGTETRWFVPHVGLVKETTSSTIDVQTSTSSAELKGYVVNGIARGLGVEFTAVGGLSAGDGHGPVPVGRPAVGSDATSFMVVARRASGIPPSYVTEWLATPMQLDGPAGAATAISPQTPAASVLSAERAAVAFDGVNYLVVYEKDNNFASTGNHPSLVAQRISPGGVPLGGASEVASPGTNSPALAFDGTNFLLAYSRSDSYGGFGQLMGVFVSPSTGQATGAEFPITAAQGYQSNPALAFGGTGYLMVWEQAAWASQAAGTYAARVTPAGSVLDAGGFAVANGAAVQPAVVFNGVHFVVAWLAVQPDNLHTNLQVTRVSTAGQLVGGGFAVTSGPSNTMALPTLALFNGQVLAAWSGDCSLGCGLYGARLVTPADPFLPIRVAGPSGFGFTAGGPYPRLAAVPAGALLLWLDRAFDLGSPKAVGALPVFPFGP